MREKNRVSADEAMELRFRSEAQFTDWVIGVLRENGWLVTHMHDSRKQHWNTHKGTPDIKAVHPERHVLLEAELKMPGKKPSPEQLQWLEALEASARYTLNFYVFRWWPKDWREIRAYAEGRERLV